MNSLRIAVYVPNALGAGTQRVMINLANSWVETGRTVECVFANSEGPSVQWLDSRIPVRDLAAVSAIKTHAALNPRLLIRFVRYLRAYRPDVVFASYDSACIIPLLARKLSGHRCKVVATVHTSMRSLGPLARVADPLVRWTFPWADAVVAVSKGIAEELCGYYGIPRQLVHTIYNPFDWDKIDQQAEEELVHPWLEAGHPPVILAVGRLEYQKDFSMLLKSLALLRRKREVRCLILGDGSLRTSLQSEIDDLQLQADVCIAGYEVNPFSWMKRSRVFALSSRFEGFPMVLVEAIGLGVPVVATDCPHGPKEILSLAGTGELVPVGSATEMANALDRVLGDCDIERVKAGAIRVRAATKKNDVAATYWRLIAD